MHKFTFVCLLVMILVTQSVFNQCIMFENFRTYLVEPVVLRHSVPIGCRPSNNLCVEKKTRKKPIQIKEYSDRNRPCLVSLTYTIQPIVRMSFSWSSIHRTFRHIHLAINLWVQICTMNQYLVCGNEAENENKAKVFVIL